MSVNLKDKGADMKIALPIDESLSFYKDNPHTAPKFAIYNIEIGEIDIFFSLDKIIENKLFRVKSNEFEEQERKCECATQRQENLRHKCDHYSLLEEINGCSYLLANKCCTNTQNSMKIGGIKVFTIPPIINKIDIAIKNFIIGGSLASQIRQIHHAS